LPNEMILSSPCQKQKSVLIIDDDYWIREALSYVLENEGCRVLTATNGQEGFEMMESSHPDLVLLDGRMPVMNGWELKQKMEADVRFKDVKVIAMSADGKHAPLMKAEAFFAKPFDLNVFVDTLKPYLH
jgi:CheY-like chemotaxis protein